MLNFKKLIGTTAAIAATFTAISLYSATTARSSDHQDSPAMIARPGADITDVFMFPSPQSNSNVVLAMDTHPLIVSGTSSMYSFDPAVMYQFKIVHGTAAYVPGAANSSAEDTVIQFAVNGTGSGQTLTMHGPAAPLQTGTTSSYIPQTASSTINYNTSTTVNVKGADGNTYPVTVYAGPRADPFYFDLAQFFKIVPDRYYGNHTGTVPAATAGSFRGFAAGNANNCVSTPAHEFLTSGGADIFTNPNGFDVLSIVVEMPRALLELTPGTPVASKPFVHLWATTSTTSGS